MGVTSKCKNYGGKFRNQNTYGMHNDCTKLAICEILMQIGLLVKALTQSVMNDSRARVYK